MSDRAPLSEDYNPSEIATDRIWKHATIISRACARHEMFGATDLDTGTDKVNPPKKILLSITIQFAGLNWKREKYREKMNHGDIGLE